MPPKSSVCSCRPSGNIWRWWPRRRSILRSVVLAGHSILFLAEIPQTNGARGGRAWFLMDIAGYAIANLTPTILTAIEFGTHSHAGPIKGPGLHGRGRLSTPFCLGFTTGPITGLYSGPEARPHRLPATVARPEAHLGLLARQGRHIATALMELGGWKSIQSVLRYAHLSPEHLADDAARIEKGSVKLEKFARNLPESSVAKPLRSTT